MTIISHVSNAFSGIWPDVPTPLKADWSIDHTRLHSHVRTLFSKGAHGILLFGEMGEGSLFDVEEKLTALELLIAQGIPASEIMLCASCSNMNDSVKLIRRALELGLHGISIMPPSFDQEANEQGIVDFFDQLIVRVNQPAWRLYMVLNAKKIAISASAIEVVLRKHSALVVGLIDEGTQSAHTLDLLKAFGDKVDVSSTHEMHHKLLKSRGVISALANILPRVLIGMSTSATQEQKKTVPGLKVKQGDERVQELITVLGKHPSTVAMKFILSLIYRDIDWARSRAPLGELPATSREYFNKSMKTFNLRTTEE
jgi:4-hydroxy-tetrahydrodipicolinate synthase